MKTKYEIVWVDDDRESIQEDVADVGDFLENFGIEPAIYEVIADENGDVHNKIVPFLENPNLDLLAIDLKMPGVNGAELIKEIRESDHVYLPIVFYSSAGIPKLMQEVAEQGLEGAFVSHRDHVASKIQHVVTSLLRKEQTVKRVRGLLMEGVGEIDVQIGKAFFDVWQRLNERQVEVYEKVKAIISERAEIAEAKVAEFPEDIETFYHHMEESLVSKQYDTYTRWRILRKCLEIVGHNDGHVEILKEFHNRNDPPSLNKLRNDYAHKSRGELEPGHNSERCTQIRQELRRQKANLKQIIELLAAE